MAGVMHSGWLWSTVAVLALSACGSKPMQKAPVEDRVSVPNRVVPDPRSATVPASSPVTDSKPLPGSENAGKPGYYTVRPKDTLIAIGLETGQSPKDLARWNQLENPNRIEIGQVLRVVPPVAENGAVSKPVSVGTVAVAPIAAPASSASASSPSKPATAASGPAVAGAATASAPSAAPVVAPEDDLGWIWPSSGAVLAGFDEVKNKGVDIGGNTGDAVVAAADGKVVYAGAGLRGYGNLVILKHNNTYLTAYAHNQSLLVKEDQAVKKGQKIAEMGNSDADRVKLHFEVRRQGKPVDPLKYLPSR